MGKPPADPVPSLRPAGTVRSRIDDSVVSGSAGRKERHSPAAGIPHPKKYCSECGTKLPESANFCLTCGERILWNAAHPPNASSFAQGWAQAKPSGASADLEAPDANFVGPTRPTDPEPSLTINDLWTVAIGKNVEYYLPQFELGKFKWNWAALFFTVPWLCYRRLWKHVFVVAFINAILIISVHEAIVITVLANFLIVLYVSSNANEFLLNRLNQQIKAIKTSSKAGHELGEELKRRGPPNMLSTIIAASVVFCLLIALGLHGATMTYW
jgi:hypothetical protein